MTYIGALPLEDLDAQPTPMYENYNLEAPRFGKYGEIMPEDEFLGLLDICDVFDLIWLEKDFAASVREKLSKHELITESILARLEAGHDRAEIEEHLKSGDHTQVLPLYFDGKVVGMARAAHTVDDNLFAHVLLENLASKAGSVLALLHLLRNTGLKPEEVDFVIECSEEGAGDACHFCLSTSAKTYCSR